MCLVLLIVDQVHAGTADPAEATRTMKITNSTQTSEISISLDSTDIMLGPPGAISHLWRITVTSSVSIVRLRNSLGNLTLSTRSHASEDVGDSEYHHPRR
jgi:hypothetical protein